MGPHPRGHHYQHVKIIQPQTIFEASDKQVELLINRNLLGWP